MGRFDNAVKFWSDAFAPTSLGTGVAKTTLNAGATYPVPQQAGALIEVTPQVSETGAHTAAESLMIRWIIESNDIPTITPKEWCTTGALGGLGTFAFTQTPMLQAFPINTALKYATSQLTISGQAQIANTVAPEANMEFVFTDGAPLGDEQFYIAPTNETNTGTAAGAVAGNDITINGGSAINWMYGLVTPGVVTASEDIEGRAQLSSVNFIGVPSPQTVLVQSIAAGLGTAVAVAIPADRRQKRLIPIGQSFIGNTTFQLDEALTATGNFIIGVGYLK